MKISAFLFTLLLGSGVQAALGQAPVAPVPPATPAAPPPPADVDIVVQGPAIPGRPARAVRSAQVAVEPMNLSGENFFRASGSSGKPSRNLVVQFSATDPDALARSEEDLAIMARILDKAARTRREEERLVLGINVDGSVFGSSSGARNMYVEGHGALFLLSVKYPLLPPPEKAQEPKVKDNTSEEWRRAREEVAGGGSADGGQFFEYAISGAGPVEEFDEDKVNDLKDALIGALKHATHLRMVKPEEFITVVVQGADSTPTSVSKTVRDGKANVRITTTARAGNSARRESVLTLRVKKADADAFASGKLDLEAFQKKVATQSYLRRPFAAAVPDMFQLPTVR